MNEVFACIHKRRSIGNLSLPKPTKDELSEVLKLALAAPDHKQLTPWRFIVLEEAGRAQLAEALLAAGLFEADKKGESLDEATHQKLLNMPNRAPMIIACITDYKAHDKVPEFEQLLSMGAAIQNILLGFESQGYHTVWRSGPLANSEPVRQMFNITGENLLAGFVYVGSSDVVVPTRTLPDLDAFVTWR